MSSTRNLSDIRLPYTIDTIDPRTGGNLATPSAAVCRRCHPDDYTISIEMGIVACLHDIRRKIQHNDNTLRAWGGDRITNFHDLYAALRGVHPTYKIVSRAPQSFNELSHPLFGLSDGSGDGLIRFGSISKWMWDQIGINASDLRFVHANTDRTNNIGSYIIPFLDDSDRRHFTLKYDNIIDCHLILEERSLRGMEVLDMDLQDVGWMIPVDEWSDSIVLNRPSGQLTGKYHTSAFIRGDPNRGITTCTPCTMGDTSVGTEEVKTRIDTCLMNLRDRLLDGYNHAVELTKSIGYPSPNTLVDRIRLREDRYGKYRKMSDETLALVAREHKHSHHHSDLEVQYVFISEALMYYTGINVDGMPYVYKGIYARQRYPAIEVRTGYNMFAMDGHAARGIKANISILISCILEYRRRVMTGTAVDDSVIDAMMQTYARRY